VLAAPTLGERAEVLVGRVPAQTPWCKEPPVQTASLVAWGPPLAEKQPSSSPQASPMFSALQYASSPWGGLNHCLSFWSGGQRKQQRGKLLTLALTKSWGSLPQLAWLAPRPYHCEVLGRAHQLTRAKNKSVMSFCHGGRCHRGPGHSNMGQDMDSSETILGVRVSEL
jgi:hypothetical protein